MKAKIEVVTQHGLLKISGRFDIDTVLAFCDASRKLLAECRSENLVVDMAGVDYMDSSALGMLLVLQEDAEKRGKTVALTHCTPFIRNILHTAQLDRLFAIGGV